MLESKQNCRNLFQTIYLFAGVHEFMVGLAFVSCSTFADILCCCVNLMLIWLDSWIFNRLDNATILHPWILSKSILPSYFSLP